MNNKLRIMNDKVLKNSFIYTVIFGIIAHGYCFFNVFLSHDSTIFIQNDILWQIKIGRFLHPIAYILRGNYFVPWLIGIISMFFVAITSYLIIKTLQIKSKSGIILTCAILITNSTITCLNATYIHETDIYMASLFFAVFGIYLLRNYKKGYIFSIILFFISLGLYQSFLNVIIFLAMLLIYIDLLNGENFKKEIKLGTKYVLTILVSLIMYYIGIKISTKIFNVSLYDGYNGLTAVGNYASIKNILKSIYITYLKVASFIIKPLGYNSIIMLISNIIIIISCIYMNIKIVIKNKIKKKELLLLIILALLIPFGINIICFISQGVEHGLMIYSFFLLYVFAIYIKEKYTEKFKIKNIYNSIKNYKTIITCGLITPMLILIIYNLCIYSNQTYYIKQNVYQNTLLTLNRIVYSIENLGGYEIGKTKVVFIGDLNNSELAKPYDKYNLRGIGTNSSFSVTYKGTYDFFINGIMHIKMNVCDENKTKEYIKNNDVSNIKPYPAKDSIKLIDDTVVVKLS